MKKIKLTAAQLLIKFLDNQYVERDGKEHKFFAGCFGIFGHGNVAGIGEALLQNPQFIYYQTRNEQAMVHTAAAFAKTNKRLRTFACTTSIGPGATNMITAAAGATINRLPVLLIPGDIFAERIQAPVLQQIESEYSQDFSVNDCFKPVSKYWDRIYRPEQLITSLPEVMRVLTSQANTGAVTLAFPQDVQTKVYDYPIELIKKRVWNISRSRSDKQLLLKAADLIKKSKAPFIVSGGGVKYSEAENELRELMQKTGIPIGETYAGKGAISSSEQLNLGGVGATGTPCANKFAERADLVIGIGTRYSDFTTASKTIFQNPNVKFININATEFDSHKHGALPLVGDAKAILEELIPLLSDYKVDENYKKEAIELNGEWDKEINVITSLNDSDKILQTEVIGVLNEFMDDNDIMIVASGSLPGDVHKLWKSYSTQNFHLEYGNSCMGYEIAGALGVKIAEPNKEIYAIVGDGNYLLMSSEIITSIQEDKKIVIIILNNNGFASIGGLSESIGCSRFGTKYNLREKSTNLLTGGNLSVNFAENARSLGADVFEVLKKSDIKKALNDAKSSEKTSVIVINTELKGNVIGYAWWDVAIPEISELEDVKISRKKYLEEKKKQGYYL